MTIVTINMEEAVQVFATAVLLWWGIFGLVFFVLWAWDIAPKVRKLAENLHYWWTTRPRKARKVRK